MSLKVIIAGAGHAGSELHLNAYKLISAVEVIALCDPDLDKAKNIAIQKGIPYVFSSLGEALNDQSADIVSVCTPPSSHFDLCCLALEHGCHVLVEKPIFQTLDEAEQIRTIIDQKDCKFSAVHSQKYLHGIQHALKLVEGRYIGDVVHIHVARMLNGNNDRFIGDDNSWCHKLPGGRWEELIAHPIYKAYQFMGPMRFVHLEMKQVHNRWPWLPADELEIILEGGAGYVSIKLSANAGDYNHMLVYGSRRILFINNDEATDLLSITHHTDSKPSLRKWLSSRLLTRQSSIPNSLRQNPFAKLIKDFVAYVRGERVEAPVDWQEAVNTLELGLQIGKEIEHRKSTIHLK